MSVRSPSSYTDHVNLYTDGPLPMLCTFRPIQPMCRHGIINGVPVWLSTTTCTPSLPRRRVRPLLLPDMRFRLGRLPSMGRRENCDNIPHFFGKKYMWSIKRCVYRSVPHWSSLWAVPMTMLYLRGRPKSAPENHAERQANTYKVAKFCHQLLQPESQLFLAKRYRSRKNHQCCCHTFTHPCTSLFSLLFLGECHMPPSFVPNSTALPSRLRQKNSHDVISNRLAIVGRMAVCSATPIRATSWVNSTHSSLRMPTARALCIGYPHGHIRAKAFCTKLGIHAKAWAWSPSW